MKKELAEFVYACLTFQKSKIEHHKSLGLMQLLSIPERKWNNISMDFVTSLPKTMKGYDSIWVVVDRLTKSVVSYRLRSVILCTSWLSCILRRLSTCMVFHRALYQIEI